MFHRALGKAIVCRHLEFFCAALSLIFLNIESLQWPQVLGRVSSWVKPYYFINYFELGFIKRGLVGTLFYALRIRQDVSPALIVVSAHAIISFFAVVLFWSAVGSAFNNGWSLRAKLPFYLFMTFCPATFLRLGADIGRLDVALFAFTSFGILILCNCQMSPSLMMLFASFLILTELLIHEVSIFYYAPLIIVSCGIAIKAQGFRSIRSVLKTGLLSLAFIITVSLCLLVYGRYEPGQQALNQYLAHLGPELSGALPIELTSTLQQNIQSTIQALTPASFFGGHPYYFTSFVIFICFVFSLGMPNELKIVVFTPLLLNFLAWDHVRFMGTCALVACLSILVAARFKSLNSRRLSTILMLILAATFFLGPWGILPGEPPAFKYFKHFAAF